VGGKVQCDGIMAAKHYSSLGEFFSSAATFLGKFKSAKSVICALLESLVADPLTDFQKPAVTLN